MRKFNIKFLAIFAFAYYLCNRFNNESRPKIQKNEKRDKSEGEREGVRGEKG